MATTKNRTPTRTTTATTTAAAPTRQILTPLEGYPDACHLDLTQVIAVQLGTRHWTGSLVLKTQGGHTLLVPDSPENRATLGLPA